MEIFKTFQNAIIKLGILISGKRLAIFGAKAVGKTTLQTFIRERILVTDYVATGISKELPEGYFSTNEINFFIKKGEDTGGDESFREVWYEIFSNSDICFYLYNTHDVHVMKRAVVNQIRYHLFMLNSWRERKNLPIEILVIGTFADLLPSNINFTEHEQNQYETLYKALQEGKIKRHDFLIGSLANESHATSLVKRIIKAYEFGK